MLLIPSSVKQKQHSKIKQTESTGDRGPLAFTSAACFFVSELEEEEWFGTMIMKCKCG